MVDSSFFLELVTKGLQSLENKMIIGEFYSVFNAIDDGLLHAVIKVA